MDNPMNISRVINCTKKKKKKTPEFIQKLSRDLTSS